MRAKEHSKELINAFKPVRYFLTAIGQMPFEIKLKADGSYAFRFRMFGKRSIIFMILFALSSFNYIMVTLGILSFIVFVRPGSVGKHMIMTQNDETNVIEAKAWENYWIRHEMMSVMVIWSWMTIAFVGSSYILFNGKYYVHFFNYWNRVVQLVDMDVTSGIKNYLHLNNMMIFITAILLLVAYGAQVVSFTGVSNTSKVISHFFFRITGIEVFKNEGSPQNSTDWWIVQCYTFFGFLIMLYSFFGSRANILQFLFFSLLLRNAARIWNERLRNVLRHVEPEEDGPQFLKRLELRQALKDHLILVQLFKMTENVFKRLLLTYYSLLIVAVVMELYQLSSLNGFTSQVAIKKEDDLPLGVTVKPVRLDIVTTRSEEVAIIQTATVCAGLLINNLLICYRTTVDAGKAYEQAMKGFDILRRHGFMYCLTKTERNFVLSLQFSFARNNPMQITAGGYFIINKALIVGMTSAVLNWAISVYQTQVDQWEI